MYGERLDEIDGRTQDGDETLRAPRRIGDVDGSLEDIAELWRPEIRKAY